MIRLVPIPGDVVRHVADDNNPPRLYKVARTFEASRGFHCVAIDALLAEGNLDHAECSEQLCAVEHTSWADRLLVAMLVVAYAVKAKQRDTESMRIAKMFAKLPRPAEDYDDACDCEDCLAIRGAA